MKRRVWAAASAAMMATTAFGAQAVLADKYPNGQVKVFNWGEYIDEDLIDEFEDEYGIEVIYDTFDTNEAMYPRVEADPSLYDVICPSDYMIEKMIQNDVLQEIDWDQITNKENIGEVYLKSCEGFDPGNKYCVPYTFGTVGILYNKELVDEDAVIDSWDVLWDETYKNDIIMQDSVRDAFMISLKRLGYSCNTTDEDELNEAMEELKIQSKLNKAYTIDEVRDKMINGAAAIGVIYSGEYLYCQEENEDLEYVIPKEGTNLFFDAVCIPKIKEDTEESRLKKLASEMYINFLNEPEIAAANIEYIQYSTPNDAALQLLDEEVRNNPISYPSDEVLENTQVYVNLSEETNLYLDRLWTEIMSAEAGYNYWSMPLFLVGALALSVAITVMKKNRRRRREQFNYQNSQNNF